jgi:hypothetical protein
MLVEYGVRRLVFDMLESVCQNRKEICYKDRRMFE